MNGRTGRCSALPRLSPASWKGELWVWRNRREPVFDRTESARRPWPFSMARWTPRTARHLTLHAVFFDDLARVLVFPHPDKFRISQMVAFGPLQEFDLRHEFRSEPNTLLHVLSGQTLAWAMDFREIDEQTFQRNKRSKFLEYVARRDFVWSPDWLAFDRTWE